MIPKGPYLLVFGTGPFGIIQGGAYCSSTYVAKMDDTGVWRCLKAVTAAGMQHTILPAVNSMMLQPVL